ncbi:unnamed protein product [Lathyrus sativus]|nr:unnamed protein product [Lathyrus sativus]
MLREGVRPTHRTFVGVLLACAHAGVIYKGLEYFESMEKVYGLTPEMKYYGCIVDLLSRSDDLERAYEFIKRMPMETNVVVWRILLSASQVHGNLPLAEIAANKLKIDDVIDASPNREQFPVGPSNQKALNVKGLEDINSKVLPLNSACLTGTAKAGGSSYPDNSAHDNNKYGQSVMDFIENDIFNSLTPPTHPLLRLQVRVSTSHAIVRR